LLLRPGSPNPKGFHIALLSTSILFALSNLFPALQKHTGSTSQLLPRTLWTWARTNMFLVDRAGNCPPRPEHFSLCFFPYGVYSNMLFIIQIPELNVKRFWPAHQKNFLIYLYTTKMNKTPNVKNKNKSDIKILLIDQ